MKLWIKTFLITMVAGIIIFGGIKLFKQNQEIRVMGNLGMNLTGLEYGIDLKPVGENRPNIITSDLITIESNDTECFNECISLIKITINRNPTISDKISLGNISLSFERNGETYFYNNVTKNTIREIMVEYDLKVFKNRIWINDWENKSNHGWVYTFENLSLSNIKELRKGGTIILALVGSKQSSDNIKWSITLGNQTLDPYWYSEYATYDQEYLQLNAGLTNLQGMSMSSDGTKAYVLDATTDRILQYNLTVPWVIATGVYYGNISVLTQDAYATSLTFNSDGTKMYLAGSTADKVFQYSLATAWNITSATYDNVNVSTVTQDNGVVSIKFTPDGTKMYTLGFTGDRVFQYNLTPAWNLTSLTYENKNLSTTTQDTSMYEIFFENDGLTMHTIGYANDKVYRYNLSTAWDISTAVFNSSSGALTTQDGTPLSLYFKSNGEKMYVLGYANKRIFQYRLYPIWQPNFLINNSIYNTGANSTPSVFYKDSIWYVLSGSISGRFTGANWTGSTWQNDFGINSSLPDIGSYSSPNIFYKDSTWYMISGSQNGDYFGFNWTGSTWQNDFGINSSLPDVGSYSSPNVFYKDSIWYIVSGEYSGKFYGFNWTGSTWQNDFGINSSLPDVGATSTPSVFYKDSTWYIVSGTFSNGLYGFNWTGSTWQSDLDINSSPFNIFYSKPNVFYKDSTWYMFLGNNVGGFYGFNYYEGTTADTIPPKYNNSAVNNTSPAILDYVLFSTNWTDNIQLANYTFGWNATGVSCDTWANDSVVTFTGIQNWSNITKQIPATCLLANVQYIGYRIYTMDNSSNQNETGILMPFITAPAGNCWQVSAGKVMIPPGCQFAINTKGGYN